MRKAPAIVLALFLCLALCACGGQNAQQSDAQAEMEALRTENEELRKNAETLINEVSRLNDELTAANETIEALSPSNESGTGADSGQAGAAPGGIIDLSFGDEINLDFVEMTVEDCGWSYDMKGGRSVWSHDLEGSEGQQYYWITGSIKNLSGNNLEFDSLNDYVKSEILVNGKYAYSAQTYYLDTSGNISVQASIKPLEFGTYYFAAQCPDEVRDIMEMASITFAFNDNFERVISYDADFSDFSHIYRVTTTTTEQAVE